MHRQLERAVAEASKLPEEDQALLGAWLLEELASERRWTEAFATSTDFLEQLANEAVGHSRALFCPNY